MGILGFLLFSVFIIMGALATIFGFRAIFLAHEADHWPVAAGQVTKAEVVSYRSQNGRHGSTMFGARVHYQYNVHGQALDSDRISFGQLDASWRSAADHVIARYPVGAAVRVHYDPRKPSEATLETGLAAGLIIMPAIGIVFMIVGSVLCLVWLIIR